MYNARHLGQLPLPTGGPTFREGWGEGLLTGIEISSRTQALKSPRPAPFPPLPWGEGAFDFSYTPGQEAADGFQTDQAHRV